MAKGIQASGEINLKKLNTVINDFEDRRYNPIKTPNGIAVNMVTKKPNKILYNEYIISL
ncbi:hypothetical protein [Gynurincola endophyticus]|uniref:hypothetical protein n=1 Tax=Gynurincola endophyticus TaxID=2479004 RepID=UPI001F343D12|nr:hypothetical protein [Gynurincola endophyticus]